MIDASSISQFGDWLLITSHCGDTSEFEPLRSSDLSGHTFEHSLSTIELLKFFSTEIFRVICFTWGLWKLSQNWPLIIIIFLTLTSQQLHHFPRFPFGTLFVAGSTREAMSITPLAIRQVPQPVLASCPSHSSAGKREAVGFAEHHLEGTLGRERET